MMEVVCQRSVHFSVEERIGSCRRWKAHKQIIYPTLLQTLDMDFFVNSANTFWCLMIAMRQQCTWPHLLLGPTLPSHEHKYMLFRQRWRWVWHDNYFGWKIAKTQRHKDTLLSRAVRHLCARWKNSPPPVLKCDLKWRRSALIYSKVM